MAGNRDQAPKAGEEGDRTLLRIALLLSPTILVVSGFSYSLLKEGTKYDWIDVIFALSGSIGAAVVWYVIFLILDIRDKSHRKKSELDFANEVRALDGKINASAAKIVRAFDRLEPREVFAAGRFYFVQHPKEQVHNAIDSVSMSTPVEVDAVGINLKAFVDDHLRTLKQRENSHLRIIVPNPLHENLALMCEREGRDLFTVQKEINYTTTAILNAGGSRAEIRWQSDIATITSVRVNSTLYWRPRFLNDDKLSNIFYHESSRSENKLLFEVLKEEFEMLWNGGEQPTFEDVRGAIV